MASTITVIIRATVDGAVHQCSGQVTGGVRVNALGQECPEYRLVFAPTWGYFGGRTVARRLGEGHTLYNATVQVIRSTGNIETELFITASASDAPSVPFSNSVAFDAASSAEEILGDGVLSVSHTATGTNLAAFAANKNNNSPPYASTSITYDGTGMTEHWDAASGGDRGAGYTLAGIATGAKTVTSTLAGSPAYHRLGVVSFTGVDQTTPVGTPVSSASTGTSPSQTVGSVNTDDMVVDSLATTFSSSWVVGADQTQRVGITTDSTGFHISTQPGSAGGVMSWTVSDTFWVHGAIAMKAAAAGGGGGGGVNAKLVKTYLE